MIDTCPHCGESLEPKVIKPESCVCDIKSWPPECRREGLPPVCEKYTTYASFEAECKNCQHDKDCHK